ncbi:MAG: hypothetical protein Q9175_006732 [Cornicularia normoerica]
MQLSQSSYRPSDPDYLDPNRPRSGHRHGHKSRDHSRHGRDADLDRDDDRHRGHGRDRSRSKSRGAEWGATLAGAAAGGLLGHKAGHGGNLGTVGGIIAGAVGAHELERGYEKRREKKRLEDPYAEERPSNHRRRSSGGLLGGMKDKVEGLLNPDSGKDKRRSKSHVSSSRRSRGDDEYSDEEYDDRFAAGVHVTFEFVKPAKCGATAMLAWALISVGQEDVRNRERIISCSKGQVVDCRVFGIGNIGQLGYLVLYWEPDMFASHKGPCLPDENRDLYPPAKTFPEADKETQIGVVAVDGNAGLRMFAVSRRVVHMTSPLRILILNDSHELNAKCGTILDRVLRPPTLMPWTWRTCKIDPDMIHLLLLQGAILNEEHTVYTVKRAPNEELIHFLPEYARTTVWTYFVKRLDEGQISKIDKPPEIVQDELEATKIMIKNGAAADLQAWRTLASQEPLGGPKLIPSDVFHEVFPPRDVDFLDQLLRAYCRRVLRQACS